MPIEPIKKGQQKNSANPCVVGRRGGIRTRDPLHPMQVRYQAALHAEDKDYNGLMRGLH